MQNVHVFKTLFACAYFNANVTIEKLQKIGIVRNNPSVVDDFTVAINRK